jgi:hypothetical protein
MRSLTATDTWPVKRKVFSFRARFVQLLSITIGTVIVFAEAIHAQTNAAPNAAAAGHGQPAVSSSAQVADVSQIPGAEVTKTGNVITGLSIKDCKVLTAADYQLIRQTESLKSLSFAHGPDDASLKILAGLPAIESFGTNGAAFSDEAVGTLATFKTLQGLTFFHPGKSFTGTGLAALAALPNLHNLTVAGSLAFADPGMAAVGQLSHLKAFRTWHSGVTIAGVKALGSLKELTTLTVGQRLANKPPTTINDDTIAVLATFSSLESLSVSEARLSLTALSKLSQIPNLKSLSLSEIDISDSDLASLKQRLPKTQIKWTAPGPGGQKRIDSLFGPSVASTAPVATPTTEAKK